MPSGSPGFVGGRLREAREARQMTAVALSELIGVTASGISSYERGRNSPSPRVLQKITTALNFKNEFFLRPERDSHEAARQTIFERSRSSATKATRKRAQHRRAWLRETLQYLENFIQLPEPNVPSNNSQVNWLSVSETDIESLARDVRRFWKLGDGPISNVALLVENHGIVVTVIDMNANDLDAFSTWDSADNRPYIVLGSDTQSPFRTRFNVCHELGHLILHKHVTPSEFNDRKFFKLIETQADRFAAAFLAPATTFSPDVISPSLDVFRILKPKWRTSIKMMIHRAQELDIIDRDEARRLYINYNRRGWNREEPLDRDYRLEEPCLARKAFEAIVENALIERTQIVAALPFNQEDVEQLANLPIGYLSDDSAYSWAIRELNSGFGNSYLDN